MTIILRLETALRSLVQAGYRPTHIYLRAEVRQALAREVMGRDGAVLRYRDLPVIATPLYSRVVGTAPGVLGGREVTDARALWPDDLDPEEP